MTENPPSSKATDKQRHSLYRKNTEDKISCENVVTSLNATDTWNTPTVSNLSCNPITNWVSNPLPVCCFEVCLLILTSVLTKALRKLPNNC